MPDSIRCDIDPARSCPNGPEIAMLKKRVGDLEKVREKEEKFRNDYYEEQRHRIRRDEQLDAKIDRLDAKVETIGEKMDNLAKWKMEQIAKPGKRWDGLVDKALWLIVGAVIAYILTQAGLPA